MKTMKKILILLGCVAQGVSIEAITAIGQALNAGPTLAAFNQLVQNASGASPAVYDQKIYNTFGVCIPQLNDPNNTNLFNNVNTLNTELATFNATPVGNVNQRVQNAITFLEAIHEVGNADLINRVLPTVAPAYQNAWNLVSTAATRRILPVPPRVPVGPRPVPPVINNGLDQDDVVDAIRRMFAIPTDMNATLNDVSNLIQSRLAGKKIGIQPLIVTNYANGTYNSVLSTGRLFAQAMEREIIRTDDILNAMITKIAEDESLPPFREPRNAKLSEKTNTLLDFLYDQCTDPGTPYTDRTSPPSPFSDVDPDLSSLRSSVSSSLSEESFSDDLRTPASRERALLLANYINELSSREEPGRGLANFAHINDDLALPRFATFLPNVSGNEDDEAYEVGKAARAVNQLLFLVLTSLNNLINGINHNNPMEDGSDRITSINHSFVNVPGGISDTLVLNAAITNALKKIAIFASNGAQVTALEHGGDGIEVSPIASDELRVVLNSGEVTAQQLIHTLNRLTPGAVSADDITLLTTPVDNTLEVYQALQRTIEAMKTRIDDDAGIDWDDDDSDDGDDTTSTDSSRRPSVDLDLSDSSDDDTISTDSSVNPRGAKPPVLFKPAHLRPGYVNPQSGAPLNRRPGRTLGNAGTLPVYNPHWTDTDQLLDANVRALAEGQAAAADDWADNTGGSTGTDNTDRPAVVYVPNQPRTITDDEIKFNAKRAAYLARTGQGGIANPSTAQSSGINNFTQNGRLTQAQVLANIRRQAVGNDSDDESEND